MRKTININLPKNIENAVKDENFRVFMQDSADEIEIFLTGVVGDDYTESDSGSISRILSRNRGKPVTLRVNSPGGLAFDGLAIHNAIAAHDGPTTAIIEGLAASAASLAVLGADKIRMYGNAVYHIHEGLSFAFGHIADLQDSIDWLKSFNDAAVKTYAAKTGRPEKEIAKALLGAGGDGTKYTADEAHAMGFVDEVIPIGSQKPPTKNAGRDRLQSMLNYRIAKHQLTERR